MTMMIRDNTREVSSKKEKKIRPSVFEARCHHLIMHDENAGVPRALHEETHYALMRVAGGKRAHVLTDRHWIYVRLQESKSRQ